MTLRSIHLGLLYILDEVVIPSFFSFSVFKIVLMTFLIYKWWTLFSEVSPLPGQRDVSLSGVPLGEGTGRQAQSGIGDGGGSVRLTIFQLRSII